MVKIEVLERYMNALIIGDRKLCRSIIEETLQSGIPANHVYLEIIWPVMVEIEALYRNDKINSAQEAMATRINRTLVDQLQNKLPRKENQNKKIVISCAGNEHGELGGQMIADLFESNGWSVRFLGSSVSHDDVMCFIHDYTPDILLIYGTLPSEAPEVRSLIDRIKAVNAFPEMKIMLSGGLFNRAEGLWEEIGADMFAPTAQEALNIASMTPNQQQAPVRTINKRKHKAQDESCDCTDMLAKKLLEAIS